MRKLVVAIVFAASAIGGVAYAQPAENPSGQTQTQEDNASAVHRAAGETDEDQEGKNVGEPKLEPVDPSEHFNFFNFHYSGKDEYGGTFGDGKEGPAGAEQKYEEEPMSAPFVLALVNFAILLFLLAKYGGPVARKTAQDRHDLIKNALDEAAKLQSAAKAKLSEYEKRIKDVDNEIKALVDGIRADADADKARILAAAEVQSAQLKRDAEARIAAEILLARAELTRDVTAAATKATEALVREQLTPGDNDRLVASFITDLGATNSPSGGAAQKEPS